MGKRAKARESLVKLKEVLELEYARGSIESETDAHVIVASTLKSLLRDTDDRWVIGANHRLVSKIPDVVCYYAPEPYGLFQQAWESCVVAVVEIKWGHPADDDLEYLRAAESKYGALVWMIYGGHFDPGIHERHARLDEERAAKVLEWEAESRDTRGSTIVRCGGISKPSQYSDRLEYLRQNYWICDGKG